MPELIISPHSSETCSRDILETAVGVKSATTQIEVLACSRGPRYVETPEDEVVAAREALSCIRFLESGSFWVGLAETLRVRVFDGVASAVRLAELYLSQSSSSGSGGRLGGRASASGSRGRSETGK